MACWLPSDRYGAVPGTVNITFIEEGATFSGFINANDGASEGSGIDGASTPVTARTLWA